MKKHLLFTSMQSALLFTLIAGCDDTRQEAQSGEFEAEPAVLESALERPLQSCRRERLSCRREADDRAGREACDDALASCLESAAERALATAAALRECRDSALECVRDGERRSTCRAQFEGCVERALDDEPQRSDAGADGEETPRGDAGVDATDGGAGSDSDGDGGSEGSPEREADAAAAGGDASSDDGDEQASGDDDAGADGVATEDGGEQAPSDDGDQTPSDDGDQTPTSDEPSPSDEEASAADAGVPDSSSEDGAPPALDGGAPDGMPEQLQCATQLRLCLARVPRSAATCAEEAQSCLDRG